MNSGGRVVVDIDGALATKRHVDCRAGDALYAGVIQYQVSVEAKPFGIRLQARTCERAANLAAYRFDLAAVETQPDTELTTCCSRLYLRVFLK